MTHSHVHTRSMSADDTSPRESCSEWPSGTAVQPAAGTSKPSSAGPWRMIGACHCVERNFCGVSRVRGLVRRHTGFEPPCFRDFLSCRGPAELTTRHTTAVAKLWAERTQTCVPHTSATYYAPCLHECLHLARTCAVEASADHFRATITSSALRGTAGPLRARVHAARCGSAPLVRKSGQRAARSMPVDAQQYHAKWEGMWGTGEGVKPGQVRAFHSSGARS